MSRLDSISLLTRREAIARLAVLLGGTFVGAQVFLQGATLARAEPAPGFSADEVALLDEIGDTIIPATDTPGAKAVQIGAFMALMVNDCYDGTQQAIFRAGLGQVDAACRQKYGKSFLAASPAERTATLNTLDAEEKIFRARNPLGAHYFSMLKQLTLLGYFTSEIGATQALRHVETPGMYQGSVPYKKGDRAWFSPPNHAIRS